MTKVITCVSALRLYEEGIFKLSDPLSDYLPEFKDMEVRYVKDNGEVHIKPAVNPIRVVDLFTMSSGLTYNRTDSVKELNEKTGENHTLKEFVSALAKDPLYFDPGTQWHYGFSHDVLGHLVEVLSGKSLGEYFDEFIFTPLDMVDTSFRLPKEKEERLALCYTYDEEEKIHKKPIPLGIRYDSDNKFESPGASLISTVDDYIKFANALCAGGIGKGSYRLLGNATIELMRTNHLDESQKRDFGTLNHGNGYGYGLGVRTMIDKAKNGSNSSIGEYGWSGLMGTYVSIDPSLDLTYVYAQQLFPSKEEYIAPRLRNVIYGCL